MGAFDTIKSAAGCPFCGNAQDWTIQFKYGNCWQYEYQIGDRIRWGGNKKGSNVGGALRTGGIAEESCQACDKDFVDAAVYFNDNRITRIELLKEPLNIQGYFERLSE